jgi:hypothetical protein
VSACRVLGTELALFLPGAAAAVTAACAPGPEGRLPAPRPLLPVLRAGAGSVR